MSRDAFAGAVSRPSMAIRLPSARRIRRLSQREYFNVVTDLLGPSVVPLADGMLPFEPTVAGFDNQDNALRVSSAYQEALANVAEKISAAVDVTKVAPCATSTGSPACLDTFVRSFARKAYGRSPTATEVTRLLGVAMNGDTYANSVQLVVETVLQSPSMLYATELGPDAGPSSPTVTLTPTELASQLSLLFHRNESKKDFQNVVSSSGAWHSALPGREELSLRCRGKLKDGRELSDLKSESPFGCPAIVYRSALNLNVNYIIPRSNFAASLNMSRFHGGSQTRWTCASFTSGNASNLFSTSCCKTGPMPQPGAVKVIFTSTLCVPSGKGVICTS